MRTLKELWLELYEVQKDQEALDKFMDSLTDEEYQLIPIKIRLEYYKQFDFTA